MKIEIERSVKDLDVMTSVMSFIELVKKVTSLSELKNTLAICETEFYMLEYGFGGSHCWVSYLNKRILLITE